VCRLCVCVYVYVNVCVFVDVSVCVCVCVAWRKCVSMEKVCVVGESVSMVIVCRKCVDDNGGRCRLCPLRICVDSINVLYKTSVDL
jgi:hypothetical protein